MPLEAASANRPLRDKQSSIYKTLNAIPIIAWFIHQRQARPMFATWPIWFGLVFGESERVSQAAFKSLCRRLNQAESAQWKGSAAILKRLVCTYQDRSSTAFVSRVASHLSFSYV